MIEHVFSDKIIRHKNAIIIVNNCTNAVRVNDVNKTSKGIVSSSAFLSNLVIKSLLREYKIANAVIVKPSKEENNEIQLLHNSSIVF